ncbi:type II secretion system protein N [Thaumasiovibrio sp. DFM-14]|uniref:type II secretion system protein N n=1 Tax=Thaumasiovibrio sp. DFM-14 TaxID=3384792 RepID=UPI0039A2D237
MKYKLLIIVSFVAVLLSSMIAHLPVSWLYSQFPVVRGLNVDGLEGTVWQGRASNVRFQKNNYGHVQWQLSAWKLLLGDAQFQVRFGRGSDWNISGRGVVGYDVSGPYAENLMASMPVTQLMRFSPMPLPIDLDGNLELALQRYRFATPYCEQLDGKLFWQSGGISTPLGDIEPGNAFADLRCDGGNVIAVAEQASSSLNSQWNLSVNTRQQYQLEGSFFPGEAFPDGLRSQLRFVGQPDNNGRYPIKFTGRF